MKNYHQRILIWGAGRIGRGFVGDLFFSEEYDLVFVDQSQSLIDQLEDNGTYTVVRAFSETDVTRVSVSNFQALHTSQSQKIDQVVSTVDVIAVATFPKDFETVAQKIQKALLIRKQSGIDEPINIIICTNLVHAGPVFEEALYAGLEKSQRDYFKRFVGVVESLIIRIAPPAPEAEVQKDPLVVWTNGYSIFPVDKKGFRGDIPELSFFRLVDDMRAEEIRKMYTYNMCHAVLGYHGLQKGYHLLVDCLADLDLRQEAEGALEEVSIALQREYGFTEPEIGDWISNVLSQTNNRTIGDTVVRMAADPMRKLRKEDRLIGPALLCLENNVDPVHIIRAIGAALHYEQQDDASAVKLNEEIRKYGISKAIHRICGLGEEPLEVKLAKRIEEAYQQIGLQLDWQKKAQKAYDLGFEYEKTYHGCGQCAFAAISEILDVFSPSVFNAATGLCGGIGLKNDGTCSAFIAGVLAIGLFYSRRRENFDGDRERKYTNFELVQQLREKFINEFGSITCHCVHEKKYGHSYDLSQKEEMQAFEDAGGHGETGCTQTVGKAAQFTIEVLAPRLMEESED